MGEASIFGTGQSVAGLANAVYFATSPTTRVFYADANIRNLTKASDYIFITEIGTVSTAFSGTRSFGSLLGAETVESIRNFITDALKKKATKEVVNQSLSQMGQSHEPG